MSTNRSPTGRTDHEPTDPPTVHAIAARLDVDAELLDRFVDEHPNPTAPVVLGWAHADPAHRDAVEAFLDDHGRTFDLEPVQIPEDDRYFFTGGGE
jgi:hypothetical protein